MDTQKIKFIANKPWLNENSPSKPRPMGKTIPDWFSKASRFDADPKTGEPLVIPEGQPCAGGKVPTWRACPALFDIMGSGYTYVTPCDIEFGEDASGRVQARVLDEQHKDFIVDREVLPQFVNPQGYHQRHFAWWPEWAVELPEGYSALYTQPLNRFELPFLTTSGIVDNDKVHLPGTMPFFFLKGMVGILPAGTPFAQIIPFKREHWESEVITSLGEAEIKAKNDANSNKYRKPDGGIYFKEVWERRKYQ